jgi:hypothetical protein
MRVTIRAFRSSFNRMASASAITAFTFLASVGGGAQAQVVPPPEFPYDECQFLQSPAAAVDPDYSVVDAMVPDLLVPGAGRYPTPICVGEPSNGKEFWSEQKPRNAYGPGLDDLKFVRRLFFYKPRHSVRKKLPLIIWAHPNESTDDIVAGLAAEQIAKDAVDHGFAFMSLQFRHPTVSQFYYDPPPGPPNQLTQGAEPPKIGVMYPSTDIATAVQWARANQRRLGIYSNDIFLVGQSRGSLAILTALMPDQKKSSLGAGDPVYLLESSLPRAVFGVQAQTTYRDDQLKGFFLKQYASSTVTNRITTKPGGLQYPLCREVPGNPPSGRFDYWCQYDFSKQDFQTVVATPLSMVDELEKKDEPSIWIRYERTPSSLATVQPVGLYVNDKGDYQDKPNIDSNAANCYETTIASEAALKCFDVHHPHFGLKLRKKWEGFSALNRKSYVFVQYANTSNSTERQTAISKFFQNYYCFFMEYQTADGTIYEQLSAEAEGERFSSVVLENGFRPLGEKIDPNQCRMRETDPWPI